MTSVTIYGASDDLIEVEGDLNEEFNPSGDGISYLAFTDGTVLSILYGEEGIWRINRIAAGGAQYVKFEADDPDKNYSDRVTLEGDIKGVVFGDRFERIKAK